MTLAQWMITSTLVFFAQTALALSCDRSELPIGGNVGIATDLAALRPNVVPTRPKTELLRVQIAWLPDDDEKRYRHQELVDIDWQTQTHTQVDLYDGETGVIASAGIRSAELLGSTDFAGGNLDIVFCIGSFRSTRGLVFAYYGIEGQISSTFVVPFHWRTEEDGLWFSAVVNELTSDLIAKPFNEKRVFDITNDVTLATGVEPPRYLTESLIQQDLQPATDLVARDHAMVFAPQNAIIIGNQIIVTGEDASVSLTHAAQSVSRDGVEIMTPDHRLIQLENDIGPISITMHGVRRPAYVTEGRATFEAAATKCANGMSTISARMLHSSILHGKLALERLVSSGPNVLLASDGEEIQVDVACDSNYELTSTRTYPVPVDGGSPHLFLDTKKANFRFGDPQEFQTLLLYYLKSKRNPIIGHPVEVSLAPELVQKIWGIQDLSELEGLTSYGCSDAGDSAMDSIDEFNGIARSILTAAEFETTGIPNLASMFNDSDGDGSVCNQGELQADGDFVREIELHVIANLAHSAIN